MSTLTKHTGSMYRAMFCGIVLFANNMQSAQQPQIKDPATQELLVNFATSLAHMTGTPPQSSAPKTTPEKRSPGVIVFGVIATSGELFLKPSDTALKNQLKKEILALKADKAALNKLRAYPKELITEIGPYPSAAEKAQFTALRKMLELINDADKTIFLKADLDLLTQATPEDPGMLTNTWMFVRRNSDLIFGGLKIASKLYFGF